MLAATGGSVAGAAAESAAAAAALDSMVSRQSNGSSIKIKDY